MDDDAPKVRIVSNGLASGTEIYVDGKHLWNVRSVTWHCCVDEPNATVTLEMFDVEVELVGDRADG